MTSKRGGTNAEMPRSTSFGAEFIINITDYFEGLVSAYVEIVPLSTRVESDEPSGSLQVAMAGSSLLDIFAVEEVAGSLDGVMTGTGFIALELEQAVTLFGSAEAAMGSVSHSGVH